MTIRHQLTVVRKTLKRLLLPMRQISVDVIKYSWFKDEECSVDPAFFRLRLLGKLDNLIPLHFQMAEAGSWTDRGESGQLAVPTVEGK